MSDFKRDGTKEEREMERERAAETWKVEGLGGMGQASEAQAESREAESSDSAPAACRDNSKN